MKRTSSVIVLAAAVVTAAHASRAEVRLPRLLADGAILQRDAPAAVYGWADEGEAVVVYLDGEPVARTRAAGGRWRVAIAPRPAGGPHELAVEGENTIVVRDLWFGDVWVASGQSNMELPMARVSGRYAAEVAAADYPLIREFDVPRGYVFAGPREDFADGAWVASSPDTVGGFSAVGWFFARALHERYGVPVGIISSNYGGTTAEGWMSEKALAEFPHYLEVARRYRDASRVEEALAADREAARAWHDALERRDAGLAAEPGWHAAELDDAGWEHVQVPASLEAMGAGADNGVFWFRRDVELPPAAAGEAAALELGRIVDADTAWVNGVEVGATTYQYPPRRYRIPAGILRAGANTLAVRLISQYGQGGFVTDKPYELRIGGETINLEGDWRYRLGAASGPLPPQRFIEHRQPHGFYNAMLAPLLGTPIKGVIWYQGESNVERAAEYRRLFPAMIRDWRANWGQGDFPFVFVQLANHLPAADVPGDSEWAELRDAQLAALCEPNTAMAVAIDLGDWNDIHPENKKDVGERLALAARKLAYGEDELVASGPMPAGLERADGALVLRFAHTGGGLVARGGGLREFDIAGEDGAWRRGEARIQDDTVVVRHGDVSRPVSVRYAWADNPADANLYNADGLPASPFRVSLTGSKTAVSCD